MKNSTDRLLNRFYDLCEDIKKVTKIEDLDFRLGLVCGFTSCLFLADIINICTYQKMHEYISTLREDVENRLNKE